MASCLIHPVQKDMINLGCRNQFSVGIAFQVYMDLCEGKTWEHPLNTGGSFVIICMSEPKPCTFATSDMYCDICDDGEVQAMQDVQYLYSHELDMLYLVGKTGRDSQSGSRTEIFLPLSTVSDITPSWIQKVQDTLCTDQDKKGITLAMKDHDSTVVYYRMTQGLVPPDSPETAHRKKQCNEQKHFIDMELRRMQHKLLDRALKIASSDKVRTYNSNEQEMSSSGSIINATAAAEEQVNTESAGDLTHLNSEATQDNTEYEQ